MREDEGHSGETRSGTQPSSLARCNSLPKAFGLMEKFLPVYSLSNSRVMSGRDSRLYSLLLLDGETATETLYSLQARVDHKVKCGETPAE